MSPVIAASMEVDNNMLMGGIVVTLLFSVAGIIGALAVVKGWIREVAGVKETTSTEISGQPLSVQKHPQFVDRDSYHKHCEINRAEHARIEARIAAVEQKREEDKEDIIHAGEDRAKAIHDRINVAIEKIGQLTGQVGEIAKRVK